MKMVYVLSSRGQMYHQFNDLFIYCSHATTNHDILNIVSSVAA